MKYQCFEDFLFGDVTAQDMVGGFLFGNMTAQDIVSRIPSPFSCCDIYNLLPVSPDSPT